MAKKKTSDKNNTDEKLGKTTKKEEGTKRLFSRLIDSGLDMLISVGDGSERASIKPLALPKELISYLFSQIDRSKSEIVSLFGREFKRFLEATDLSEEVVKAMKQLTIEVKAEISFKENNGDENKIKINKKIKGKAK